MSATAVLNHSITQKASTGLAVGSLATPIWFEYLQHVSETAALLLPIAGLVWLLVQMAAFFNKRDR